MMILTEVDRSILIGIVAGCISGLVNGSLDTFLKRKIDNEKITLNRLISGLLFSGIFCAILLGISAFVSSLDINFNIEEINHFTITMAIYFGITPLIFRAIDLIYSKIKALKTNSQ